MPATQGWLDGNVAIIEFNNATCKLPTDLTVGIYEYLCSITAPGCRQENTRWVTVTVKPAGTTSTYDVTINNGTANPPKAAKDDIVIITANTVSGKQFKEWTVSCDVIFTNGTRKTDAVAQFEMPENAVVDTATYEDIPVSSVALNKESVSLYRNTSPTTATLIATVNPSNAVNKSVTWRSDNIAVATVDERGNVTAVGNGKATITVTTTDGNKTASCGVTVSTYTSGGGSSSGGGGGSSSGGGSSTKVTITTENKPNQPVTGVISVPATRGTNDTATASIPDKSVSDAISKSKS